MAQITIESRSVELAQVEPPNYAPLKSNQLGGRVRASSFTVNTGAGLTDGDNIALTKIPRGARILGGEIAFGAMGGSATADIGIAAVDGSGEIDLVATSDTDDFFATALDVSGAGEDMFATTIAQNWLYETVKEVFLVLTIEGASWAASQTFVGIVEYMVD